MDGFVDVYVKATGKKQRVPAHYLDHPILGRPFSKTPRQKAAENQAAPKAATTKAPAAGDQKE